MTATATASVASDGTIVNPITITNGGSGYTSVPTVMLVGVNGTFTTQATATAFVTNGVVTSIIVNNSGAGYISTPQVVISPPTATAVATAVISNNKITSFNISQRRCQRLPSKVRRSSRFTGGGFHHAPAVVTANLTNGVVTSISIPNGGSAGYTGGPDRARSPPRTASDGHGHRGDLQPRRVPPLRHGHRQHPDVARLRHLLPGRQRRGRRRRLHGLRHEHLRTPRPPPPRRRPPILGTGLGTGGNGTAVGSLSAINFTTGGTGAGYTSVPTVTLTGGGSGTGFIPATVTALLTNGVVTGFVVNSAGTGYNSAPTVSIEPPDRGCGQGGRCRPTPCLPAR